ncbi:MAG: fumarate reductase subunit C [Gammaproteobacteria bacterium]|nr:MAG: fumarate reductase subunit C [Gammaproteobacteria bacterium]
MTAKTDKVIYRKPYVQKQSPWWWASNPFYVRYMIREGTSVFVLLYSLVLISGLWRLSQGEAAWNQWLATLGSPLWIVFHVIALAAALYHAYTWFKLAPKIMQVRIGGWTLPEKAMLAGQWAGFVVVTLLILGVVVFAGGAS